MLVEHRGGNDPGRERAGERLRFVIDEKHPVSITVERQSNIGPNLEHA
jgi:hypothetical protein